MISSLKRSLKIDICYAVNSFIYSIRKLPILDDLITDDIYKSKRLKGIIRIISLILSFGKMIVGRLLYFLVIYISCLYIFESDGYFQHVFFIFTLIGMFINNKLLNTSQKKYLSILVFNMESKKFMWSSLVWDLFINVILNSIGFLSLYGMLNIDIVVVISLILLCLFCRVIGEGLNIFYYKKFGYIWYNNYPLYFSILGILLSLCLLPLINISISNSFVIISTIVMFICSIISFLYLRSIDDYKIMFKHLNSLKKAMNEDEARAYSRQSMVEIKNKDKEISLDKIKGKKGYDLFNTIFYERHKEILENSSRKYSLIIFVLYAIFIGIVIFNDSIDSSIHNFLMTKLGMFVFIMYFINRGSIVTQAMFYNCDHAMLTYNFYREPSVLLGLFKKRLISIIKVNLLPAFLIGLGNSILLYLTGGAGIITYISSFMFIILFCVFFSVHYLVLYYLLQPYNKNMQVKKISYSIASFLTYYFSYVIFWDLVLSSLTLSVIGIIFTITYIVLALFLVYKFAPRTFKIVS